MTEEITVREAGRRGGTETKRRYGHEFYQTIGDKGGSQTSERYGSPFYKAIGQKGGRANAERHDHEHFVNMGKAGGGGAAMEIHAVEFDFAGDPRRNSYVYASIQDHLLNAGS